MRLDLNKKRSSKAFDAYTTPKCPLPCSPEKGMCLCLVKKMKGHVHSACAHFTFYNGGGCGLKSVALVRKQVQRKEELSAPVKWDNDWLFGSED